ncbi:uncharacterized protein LOC124461545 [Drosophila willistoni]|uniref:uncharacterized protein LOC124461545 n=1 Tax=Drosophila willistoni TaxID=7260 RepID=UPI001F07F33E|nr:uncharacterized protein LOC124461545 [Drosophila willistoni]
MAVPNMLCWHYMATIQRTLCATLCWHRNVCGYTDENFERATKVWRKLHRVWQPNCLEEIAVYLALAHMAQMDDKLSRLVFTNNIKTRNEMQQQLQAHTFKKRNLDDDSSTTGPERKKPKYLSQVKCNYCGKSGHKYAECRARQRTPIQGKSHYGSSSQGSKDRSTVKCFKCDELEHFASACPKGGPRGNDRVIEKRVDICTVAPPSGTICSSTGESIPFCFDSGAECSLVK